jgi:two-component system chemotaxis sensor kinase CheA
MNIELLFSKLNLISTAIGQVSSSEDMELLDILVIFNELKEVSNISIKLKKIMERGFDLVEAVVSSETDFDNGIKKIIECVGRASKELAENGVDENGGDDEKESINIVDIESDINQELLMEFGKTQTSTIEDFEGFVLEYENGDSNKLEEISRILHTWKGEMGVIGIINFSKLVHKIEEFISSGKITPDYLLHLSDFIKIESTQFSSGIGTDIAEQQIEDFFSEKSKSNSSGESVEKNSSQPEIQPVVQQLPEDTSVIVDFIAESTEHLEIASALLLELEVNPEDIENINTIFRAFHTIKGVAGFLGFASLQNLTHEAENLMDLARCSKVVLTSEHLDALFTSVDCSNQYIENIMSSESGGNITDPPKLQGTIELFKKILNSLENGAEGDSTSAKKVLNVAPKIETAKEAVTKTSAPLSTPVSSQNKAPVVAAKRISVEESIRVPVGRLDKLIEFIGEAVIAQSMVFSTEEISSINDSDLQKGISNASMIMHKIQELSMSLRMMSLKQTFQKMGRVVRDISKKTGKDTTFIIEGEDTELDKTVIEHISDPLLHMVRNSVDHGLEDLDGRIAAGKSEKGNVTLRAFHHSGSVVIQIEDDGKGLDPEVLLKKAQENGVAEVGKSYTDKEIFNFIFAAGFSTAEVVTDISGRGVGMDVVRKNIQKLRGSIDIESTLGQGTVFSIRLPLTLAIINGMVIRADGERYIFPVLSIIESIKPEPAQIESVLGRGETIRIRDEIYPLVHLNSFFYGKKTTNDSTKGFVIIVEDMVENRVGVFVDEIIGQQQVVIKPLGQDFEKIEGLTGGAIMNDGKISLIVDVAKIIEQTLSI